MTNKTTAVNYTEDQANTMCAMYTGTDNVNEVKAISAAIDKPVNSVRAKLSSLGLYVKAEAVKTATDKSSTKAAKANTIAGLTGMTAKDQEDLTKTTAGVLDKLLARLTNDS